jgi:predicted Zn-dependent peptidase
MLKRKDETISSLQNELEDSLHATKQAQRELQLAVPSPPSAIDESRRMSVMLNTETEAHSKTKEDLYQMQKALTAVSMEKSEITRAEGAQQQELSGLREQNMDQAAQIQVGCAR